MKLSSEIELTNTLQSIYEECQAQSAKLLALPQEKAHQDNSNGTQQPTCEFPLGLPPTWIKLIRRNQDKSKARVKPTCNSNIGCEIVLP